MIAARKIHKLMSEKFGHDEVSLTEDEGITYIEREYCPDYGKLKSLDVSLGTTDEKGSEISVRAVWDDGAGDVGSIVNFEGTLKEVLDFISTVES